MTKASALKGRFFVHYNEYGYKSGEVTDYADGIMLLKPSAIDGSPTSQILVDVMDITGHFDDCGFPTTQWNFFDTEKEMQDFVEWLRRPSDDDAGEPPKTANVIKLVSNN